MAERFGLRTPRQQVAVFALMLVLLQTLLPESLGWVQRGKLRAQELAPAAAVEDAAASKKTYVIRLEGEIAPGLQGFFERSLSTAISDGAEVVVLDIESPGGRLDTTIEMVNCLNETEGVEFVAFIRHSAYSGAAMLALACDRIEMHPDAQLGDVGVIVGGPFSPFQYVDEKQRSPVVAQMRTLADAHNRPAALAEAMVDKDVNVYSAVHNENGATSYFTGEEWESLPNQDQWTKGPPVFESREGTFLTVSGQRAVELGLAEDNARSLDGVLDGVNAVRPATVLAWSWADSLIVFLNSPWIAALLLLVAFSALIFELSAPGLGSGGLLSLLCFALFFWSRFLGGTAGWLEVTLFLTSLAFIAAEVFVLPGFGIAGITGICMLVLSLVMASRRFLLPQSSGDLSDLAFNILAVLGALVGVFITAFFAADHLGKMPFLRSLVLQPPTPFPATTTGSGVLVDENGKKIEPTNPVDRIGVGDLGEAISPLRPSGKAQFAEDIIDVTSEGDFIDSGTPIRVHRKNGNRIIVREA